MTQTVENFTLTNKAPGTWGIGGNGDLLMGGKYYVEARATGTGTIDLQRLSADGTTWTAQITQITTTAGKQTLDLPPGKYRWVTATFTAAYLEIQQIPYRA